VRQLAAEQAATLSSYCQLMMHDDLVERAAAGACAGNATGNTPTSHYRPLPQQLQQLLPGSHLAPLLTGPGLGLLLQHHQSPAAAGDESPTSAAVAAIYRSISMPATLRCCSHECGPQGGATQPHLLTGPVSCWDPSGRAWALPAAAAGGCDQDAATDGSRGDGADPLLRPLLPDAAAAAATLVGSVSLPSSARGGRQQPLQQQQQGATPSSLRRSLTEQWGSQPPLLQPELSLWQWQAQQQQQQLNEN
jgi:hypothetical protein